MYLSVLRNYVMILKGYHPQFDVTNDDKTNALEKLKELTDQDFGRDTKKWIEWIKKNRPDEYF